MKHFLLIANESKPKAVAMAERVKKLLEERGCVCTKEVTQQTDCVLVFGGDGTLLQAARNLRDQELPFLGINLGRLGYLAEVDPGHVEQALSALLDGPVPVEKRMMLFGQVLRDGTVLHEDVSLNDIAIGSRGMAVLNFRVFVDGEYLTTYQADGMVVASPTGSTAYNLSAGGPVVNPQASLLVLTPVSPHTLISRSIVLESRSVVELEILRHPSRQGTESCVSFDGDVIMSLQPKDRVRICRSEQTTRIIKLNKLSFLETLRRKMGDRQEEE